MKTGTIKYSAEFRTPDGLGRWAGIELQYDQTDEDEIKVYKRAIGIVDAFIALTNEAYTIQVNADKKRMEPTIDMINSCQNINVLRSYERYIGDNKELRDAYDIRQRDLRVQDGTYFGGSGYAK
jgi:hypothetical protein